MRPLLEAVIHPEGGPGAVGPQEAPISADIYLDLVEARLWLARNLDHVPNEEWQRARAEYRFRLAELPWHLLRYPHTAALRNWLSGRYRVGTARTYLSALRGVLRDCWRLELLSTDAHGWRMRAPILTQLVDMS